jgi:hypothetical protein
MALADTRMLRKLGDAVASLLQHFCFHDSKGVAQERDLARNAIEWNK